MPETSTFTSGRVLVVAFEGWNDAGEAASNAVRTLKDQLTVHPVAEVDPEDYFDYQFNRPSVALDEEGNRGLIWPSVTIFGPDVSTDVTGSNVYLLLGAEPSRGWKTFTSEILEVVEDSEITAIVFLGAMLADVPHTRPISIFVSSENSDVRTGLGVERSNYEGPVGILSVLGDAAEKAGIPTVSIWASVPHYVHNAPSPKATLALIEKLEEMIGVVIPRGELVAESEAWESGIDVLAGDDEDMAAYIEQLEQARDTVDSPEASGEAIAQEFERYLRRRDGKDNRGGAGEEPWRPPGV
ncbi:putative ATP-grasp superfamily ATP-dependent carboligase [Glaciihabitans tibetensis]|uniref:Putative ATP-grasp superfamily ATP-dependent carboligase n=1 Tax=Glaciihabitans tibetensis TaxID=1266600 RepID=A0A2T0VJZ3_9MICO|nr:PAC2 family protein [Glaciihabitans tibetensis]PRY70550.1 putative ATP-grasp superfamily ATP-dependent carboligase [Glaciihabitans tibetensis]